MSNNNLQITTLAGGCFWCLEAVFEQIYGVKEIVSGYTGGNIANPSYESVCTGTTGHAEAIKITFDPDLISFKVLLELFFVMHDPTTLNRQGPDVGTQYRSVIFFHNLEQKNITGQVINKLEESGLWENPIVTDIEPEVEFYDAEEYHQEYYRKNPNLAYCAIMISPKLAKLRKYYSAMLYRNIARQPI